MREGHDVEYRCEVCGLEFTTHDVGRYTTCPHCYGRAKNERDDINKG